MDSKENQKEVEPGQSYEYDLFRPDDAEGVTSLFKTVYGVDYPIRTFIEPRRLIEENAAARTISAVARTPRGDIVAHVALFNSAPCNRIYEAGAGLVHPLYRGGAGIFTILTNYVVEKGAEKFNAETVYGEPVLNHLFSQKAQIHSGYVAHALEANLMPSSIYDKEKSAQGRVSTLLCFKTFKPKPHSVFLPADYEGTFRWCYRGLDDERTFQVSNKEEPPGLATELSTQVFSFAQVARIAVNRAGADFITVLKEEERKLLQQQVSVFQVWLNLGWPWINQVVRDLQTMGYFWGGLLPRWFDQDGMLMQKTMARPNWEGIQVTPGRHEELLRMARADWERITNAQRQV
jgi:hypothetical protein